jgi:hypothetical protein
MTYEYTFIGWNKDVKEVCEGNATYVATFKESKIEYTVVFKNYDGSEILSTVYYYGDKVLVPNAIKPADNMYTYTFMNWGRPVSETCDGNREYVAQYEASLRLYTVEFKDEDGSLISTNTYVYNDIVDKPTNPVKESTNEYKYSFAGWDKEVSTTCQGNVTYVATYTATKKYVVTFKDDKGEVGTLCREYGATIGFIDYPVGRDGKKISAWKLNGEKVETETLEITSDIEIVVEYESAPSGPCQTTSLIDVVMMVCGLIGVAFITKSFLK